MASTYHETYAAWQRDPDAFWGEAAKDIDWFTAPATVFDASEGIYGRWFPDGVCNTCYNCVDRHVAAGRGAQNALIYDSAMTETVGQRADRGHSLGGVWRVCGGGTCDAD